MPVVPGQQRGRRRALAPGCPDRHPSPGRGWRWRRRHRGRRGSNRHLGRAECPGRGPRGGRHPSPRRNARPTAVAPHGPPNGPPGHAAESGRTQPPKAGRAVMSRPRPARRPGRGRSRAGRWGEKASGALGSLLADWPGRGSARRPRRSPARRSSPSRRNRQESATHAEGPTRTQVPLELRTNCPGLDRSGNQRPNFGYRGDRPDQACAGPRSCGAGTQAAATARPVRRRRRTRSRTGRGLRRTPDIPQGPAGRAWPRALDARHAGEPRGRSQGPRRRGGPAGRRPGR